MRAHYLLFLLLLPIPACLGLWWLFRTETPKWTWKEAKVEQTDVRSLVTATGNVEAVTTVQVGTQVSGIVAERLVDFNDVVRKGQLLARIDATLSGADVEAAEARLSSARASEGRSRLERERVAALFAQGAATARELELAESENAIDVAERRSAEVALRRARRNLYYTDILAPIDGVVVRRDVDVGQTVNAGFSAPTLFVLAGDLSQVQVVASVDEADVGRVQAGQPVEVSVQAWPGQSFPGTVRQLRLQSKLVDNVVTYPTVVSVENKEQKLRPGMTAILEFLVAEAKDVLCAPNAALRFRPEAEMLAPGPKGRSKAGLLWPVQPAGLHSLPVELGLRGSSCTEVKGEGLGAGLPVVIAAEAPLQGSASPFGSGKTTSGFRGGGF